MKKWKKIFIRLSYFSLLLRERDGNIMCLSFQFLLFLFILSFSQLLVMKKGKKSTSVLAIFVFCVRRFLWKENDHCSSSRFLLFLFIFSYFFNCWLWSWEKVYTYIYLSDFCLLCKAIFMKGKWSLLFFPVSFIFVHFILPFSTVGYEARKSIYICLSDFCLLY